MNTKLLAIIGIGIMTIISIILPHFTLLAIIVILYLAYQKGKE